MTTYILAGGNDRGTDTYGRDLSAAVRQRLPESLKVLSCLFATPREDWEVKFPAKEEWFRKIFGNETKVAMAFPSVFDGQAREADLIYIHGGDDGLLDYYFGGKPGLAAIFKDKIVVGSSAGANFLSSYYWTCDWREARIGSGLTPLNVIPHYDSTSYGVNDPRGIVDWRKAEAELQDLAGSDALITPIPEGEFVVVEA